MIFLWWETFFPPNIYDQWCPDLIAIGNQGQSPRFTVNNYSLCWEESGRSLQPRVAATASELSWKLIDRRINVDQTWSGLSAFQKCQQLRSISNWTTNAALQPFKLCAILQFPTIIHLFFFKRIAKTLEQDSGSADAESNSNVMGTDPVYDSYFNISSTMWKWRWFWRPEIFTDIN